MAVSETGHAKNVANFGQLAAYAESLGAAYNPSNPAIGLEALQAAFAKANETIGAYNTAFSANSTAVTDRQTAFGPVKKLVTKVCNSYKSCGATEEQKKSVISMAKKLKGIRASAKLTEEQIKELAGNNVEKKQISSAQTGFDDMINNLDKLVKLLRENPLYAPNEEELKTAALEALYSDLIAKNTAAINADTALTNARDARNQVLYLQDNSLVSMAGDVKTYLKSVDGATGQKFKAISKLKFVNMMHD